MSVPSSNLAELEAFLARHPEIVQFEAFLTDASGVQRGKILRPEEMVGSYKNGRPLPCSILSLDITGADVEETDMLWNYGDSDRPCMPVNGTLTLSPWRETPTAQLLLTSYEVDGTPTPADPRHVLANVISRFHAHGLYPAAAIELEFYVVDQAAANAGQITPARGHSGFRPAHLQAYLMQDLSDFGPFLDDVYAGAKAMGLPTRTLISEYSPGQLEIVLDYRTDPMRACDEAILYKRLVKGMAEKHGLVATFMAKPYADLSGSGMHVHASLNDAEGNNLFAGEGNYISPLLAHSIAGLEATMAESMAIFAPNANSFRRFKANSYAPVGPAWAIDNRTVPLRVTNGPPKTRHLEHRVSGADANPYLVLATVLSGMLEGIEKGLAPSAPIVGNGYEQIKPSLPRWWPAAIDKARESDFLARHLSPRFLEIYAAIKAAECDRFNAIVNSADVDWYLRLA